MTLSTIDAPKFLLHVMLCHLPTSIISLESSTCTKSTVSTRATLLEYCNGHVSDRSQLHHQYSDSDHYQRHNTIKLKQLQHILQHKLTLITGPTEVRKVPTPVLIKEELLHEKPTAI